MSAAYASMQHLADGLEQASRELDSLVDRIVGDTWKPKVSHAGTCAWRFGMNAACDCGVDAIRPKRWIAQSVQGHPYRITDGCRDFGQYATFENAKRALAEMGE